MEISTNNKKIRVLHCIFYWEVGGIESWLMNLLRLRNPEVQFDFVVMAKGSLEKNVIELGGNILRIPLGVPAYFRIPPELRKIMLEGNYDVVHAHWYDFSGNIMQTAAECGIPVRIAHSHSVQGKDHSLISKAKICYHRLITVPKLWKYATNLLGCSRNAGEFAFGKRLWQKKGPKEMVYCGIPLEPFDVDFDPEKRLRLCRDFDIPEDAVIIGNLGRLCYQKNQKFLVEVFSELAKRDERYVLFIGGNGELRKSLESQISKFGLEKRVFMPGNCYNVPELICHLFDVFCLPSYSEGFGLAMLESISGGLYCVCSDVFPREFIDAIPDRITKLSFSDSKSKWCDAIEEGIRKKKLPREGVSIVRKTPFTIESSMENLLKVYRGENG